MVLACLMADMLYKQLIGRWKADGLSFMEKFDRKCSSDTVLGLQRLSAFSLSILIYCI